MFVATQFREVIISSLARLLVAKADGKMFRGLLPDPCHARYLLNFSLCMSIRRGVTPARVVVLVALICGRGHLFLASHRYHPNEKPIQFCIGEAGGERLGQSETESPYN